MAIKYRHFSKQPKGLTWFECVKWCHLTQISEHSNSGTFDPSCLPSTLLPQYSTISRFVKDGDVMVCVTAKGVKFAQL